MRDKSLEQLNREMEAAETDPFTGRRYEQFARHMPVTTSHILDIGCNTGRGGRVMRSRFPNATIDGVDLVPEYVAEMSPGVYDHLAKGHVQDYQAPEASYDALIAGEVLEHVPLDSVDLFLDAVKRLLRPGGLFLLTTPNPHYLLLRLRSPGTGTMLGGAHVSPHCPTALHQYLRYVGFSVKKIVGSGRVSTLIGTHWPMPMYGSYLIVAQRPSA